MKHHLSRLIVLTAALAAVFATHAAPVTYVLSPFSDGPSTLSGSITVNDINLDNRINLAEIIDWQFQSTGHVVYSFGKFAGPGVYTSLTQCDYQCFAVVGGGLVYDFGANAGEAAAFLGYNANEEFNVEFRNVQNGVGGAHLSWYAVLDGTPKFARINRTDANSFAPTQLQTVSEPGSLALLGVAGAILGWTQRRRRTGVSTR